MIKTAKVIVYSLYLILAMMGCFVLARAVFMQARMLESVSLLSSSLESAEKSPDFYGVYYAFFENESPSTENCHQRVEILQSLLGSLHMDDVRSLSYKNEPVSRAPMPGALRFWQLFRLKTLQHCALEASVVKRLNQLFELEQALETSTYALSQQASSLLFLLNDSSKLN